MYQGVRMSANKGLGRGLEVLWGGNVATEKSEGQNNLIAIEAISPNPSQPRRHFDEEALKELAESIRAQGILQPLLVRPDGTGNYQIVAGERRWRAARMANLSKVPVVIREMSDKEVMAAALIENLQREDLNAIEEAQALKELRDALNITQEELAKRLGKSRPAIANAMRLLQLSESAQEDVRYGRMSAGHARCLLSLQGPEAQEAAEILRRCIVEDGITVREAEEAVECWKKTGWLPEYMLNKGMENAPIPQPEAPVKPTRKKSTAMKLLQRMLNEELCKTSVSGDATSGRITLRYNSPEELQTILQRLGVSLPEENSEEVPSEPAAPATAEGVIATESV